jgi:hypothetical protein
MAAWMKVYQLLDEEDSVPIQVSSSSTPRELASDIAELMADVFLSRKEESRC